MKSIQSFYFVGAVSVLSTLAVARVAVAPHAQPDSSALELALVGDGDKPDKAGDHFAKAGPSVCIASDLIGLKVVSPQGESLGKIEDLVVHPGGDVAYGVLSFGGVLGVGDKLFAIPWSVLHAKGFESTGHEAHELREAREAREGKEPKESKEKAKEAQETRLAERTIVLSIEKDKLKNAPGFDKNHWPSMVTMDWGKEIDTFYDAHRKTDTGAAAAGVWKYSELKGFDVQTPNGDKLGDIKELAIDTAGRVNYVVLSVGGFLGIGDRLVAAPWDALKVMRDGEKGERKKITLAITKDRLEQAPIFQSGREKGTEMCNPAWIGKLYDYYSIRPYWPSDM